MLWLVKERTDSRGVGGKHGGQSPCFRQGWIQGLGPYCNSSVRWTREPQQLKTHIFPMRPPTERQSLPWHICLGPRCPSWGTMTRGWAQLSRYKPQMPCCLPSRPLPVWPCSSSTLMPSLPAPHRFTHSQSPDVPAPGFSSPTLAHASLPIFPAIFLFIKIIPIFQVFSTKLFLSCSWWKVVSAFSVLYCLSLILTAIFISAITP